MVNQLKQEIIKHIASEPVAGLRRADVLKRLGHVSAEYFKSLFKGLVQDGTICKKRGGRYVLAEAASKVKGVYHSNPRGFGFVQLENGKKDIYIPAEETGGALNGDTVQVAIHPQESKLGPSGKVVAILERKREDFIGCLEERNGAYGIRPLRRDLPSYLPIHQDGPEPDLDGAAPGEWIRASFFPHTDPRSPLEVVVARRIGMAGTVTGDINAVCKEFCVPAKYTRQAEENAATITPLVCPREDCRDLEMFTIDPPDAMDFDDGVSVRAISSTKVEIGVHIADVACYVSAGTALDKAAARRGFTYYLPTRTIGMLPEALSSQICSLREGEDKLTHSIFLTVNLRTGAVLETRRAHTLTRSRKRLNYQQVDRLIGGERQDDIPDQLSDTLVRLARLTRIMRSRRQKTESFLPFDSTEIRVVCAGRPARVADIVRIKAGPSADMIEELMLAANSAVAEELQTRQIPALYRVHAPLPAESMAELSALGYPILGRHYDLGEREGLIQFINDASKADNGEALTLQILRCMPRALYSQDCTGHFGLGKELYCHFTSPIRRYPDLLVHRQLMAADKGEASISQAALDELEMAVNALEQNCDQAYFAATDRLKMHKLQDDVNAKRVKDMECIITRVVNAGMSLYLPDYGLMAFLPCEFLVGRNWTFDKKHNCLSDRQHRYRCGNVIYARPKSIDAVRGEILMKQST